MKKNLSKTLAMVVILSNVGVISTTQVLAQPKLTSISEGENLTNKSNFCPSLLGTEKCNEKKQYLIKFEDNFEISEYIDAVRKIEVNGVEYKKSYSISNNEYIFSINFGGLLLSDTSFKEGENIINIKADGYNDSNIKIKFDGTFIEQQGINKEKKSNEKDINKNKEDIDNVTVANLANKRNEKDINKGNKDKEPTNIISGLSNNLEDGVYTIQFDAYKNFDTKESSMLGGFFDKNIKLEVKNKKMTLTFLNTLLSEMIIDFRLSCDKNFPESVKENISDIGKNGELKGQTITVPVTDLTKPNIVGVLVTAMGGQKSDIGNMEKYKKATVVFKNNYKKGWDGFNEFNKKISEDEVLDKALIEQQLDLNKDGKISEDELEQASETIDLSGCEIKDISKLKYLGKNVKKLILGGNQIETLPMGVFDNLTNLEVLSLNNNNISVIPKGVFDKLPNLKRLQLGNNKIKYIQEGTFDKLNNLKSVSLNGNYLNELPDNLFKGMTLLDALYLDNNNLNKIPNSIESLKHINFLYLGNNNLEFIPEYLGNLENMKTLDLKHNKINKLPSSIYNLKKLKNFDVKDNEIVHMPKNIDEIFEFANIDISLNKINTDKMANLERLVIKPQKIETENLIKAEDGQITIESKLSPLDLLVWDGFWDRSLPNNKFANIEDYKKYLNNRNVEDTLNSRRYDWTIKTDIQKKDNNGEYKTLESIIEEDKEYKPFKYFDKNMKNGDEYRIITTVLAGKGAIKELQFVQYNNGVAKVDKIKENTEKKENKISLYQIKNNIEDTSEIGKSMVRKVLKDITKVEWNNDKNNLIFDMDTQGYLKDIHTFIEGQEVPHEEIKDGGNKLKIKVQTPSNDSKVGMKMFVIPMNRFVEFSVAHDKNTLKALGKNIDTDNNENKQVCIQKDKPIELSINNTPENSSLNDKNDSNIEENILEKKKNKCSDKNNNIILPRTGQPIGANVLSLLGSSITVLGLLFKKKNRK